MTAAPANIGTTVDHGVPPVVHGRLRRAVGPIGDLLGAAAIALCIPLVILALGLPLVLGLRFLLSMAGML